MSESAVPMDQEFELASQIERRRNQPDLCTIYRSETKERQYPEAWITAKGDAFVDPRTRR